MGLTSMWFLVLLGLLAAGVVGGTARLWNRWPRRAAWALRLGGLLLIMVFGALLAGDQENRTYVFYASFGELFGGRAPATRTVSAVDGRLAQSVTLRGWATMGYSTGGYCAVDVAVHHPGRYAAAASLSGYFTAVADRSGVLFHGSRTARAIDSPTWYVRHHAGPTPALYLMGSKGDPDTVAEIRALTAALGRTRPPTAVVLASGGHNFTVWSAVSGPAFDWVAAHLPSPLAPALSAAGIRPPAPPVPLAQLKHARGRELARGADPPAAREKKVPRPQI